MDRAQGIRRLLYIVTLLTGAVLIASLAIYLTFHVPVSSISRDRFLNCFELYTGHSMVNWHLIYLCHQVATPLQTVTPRAWLEYQDRKANGVAPFLTDFSYAGYHYQATPLPHVNGTVFDVTHYGAHPGQGCVHSPCGKPQRHTWRMQYGLHVYHRCFWRLNAITLKCTICVCRPFRYADDGVQAAIDAAQVAGGGIVYFPAGEYKFGPASGGKMGGNCLRIGTSNIVLRGEGTDKTVLFLDKYVPRSYSLFTLAYIRISSCFHALRLLIPSSYAPAAG